MLAVAMPALELATLKAEKNDSFASTNAHADVGGSRALGFRIWKTERLQTLAETLLHSRIDPLNPET
ncbi:hypothetical protein AMTR_s00102p00041310 [Amborella trichopoda]|uniref:Uncharacterized protein n=1 Tax=Amborella trichopoda TaxID=13333 RepID=W1NYX3_AMBTC|nr:hypothetical protein AMTR_s00102p00041310 [Amborella trichopoda]